MSYRDAAAAGGVHEDTLAAWRKRGAIENNTIYSRFLGRINKAAELTGIAYLEAMRKSIMESPVKVREHIKKDESGKVILTEIHRETLPPDIRGAMWWLERRFPEQFGPPRPDGSYGQGRRASDADSDADSRAQAHARIGEIRRRSATAHARRCAAG